MAKRIFLLIAQRYLEMSLTPRARRSSRVYSYRRICHPSGAQPCGRRSHLRKPETGGGAAPRKGALNLKRRNMAAGCRTPCANVLDWSDSRHQTTWATRRIEWGNFLLGFQLRCWMCRAGSDCETGLRKQMKQTGLHWAVRAQ